MSNNDEKVQLKNPQKEKKRKENKRWKIGPPSKTFEALPFYLFSFLYQKRI